MDPQDALVRPTSTAITACRRRQPFGFSGFSTNYLAVTLLKLNSVTSG
jgi:hypothetical protein